MNSLRLWLLTCGAGWLLGAAACTKSDTSSAAVPPPDPTRFTNPLLASGPDPWVYEKDGFYYYMHTTGGDLRLWKTAKMSELRTAPSKVIWTPAASGSASRDVWAPEIHFLDGKWYVYFTAGPGDLSQQRTWVLENASADPTTGTWTEKGRIRNPNEDFWAIDGTVLTQGGKNYFLWSGHSGTGDNEQRLYISEMSNPWTLTGPRVELSRPTLAWEQAGQPDVNEGPEILQRNGKTFLVYSASHCSTDEYALGLLTATATADPLLPASWTKTATPVFVKDPADRAYGPGHNGFFKSKDGTQDWILYHANPGPGQDCRDNRSPRMQPFTWNADGSPNFGDPAPLNTPLPKPSGE